MNSPFDLEEIRLGTWRVSWPGHEHALVNDRYKARNLLAILFDNVKVYQAQIEIFDAQLEPERRDILHIDVTLWKDPNPEVMTHIINDRLLDNIISGVTFRELAQAERFKELLEQRLAWRVLGGNWDESVEHS